MEAAIVAFLVILTGVTTARWVDDRRYRARLATDAAEAHAAYLGALAELYAVIKVADENRHTADLEDRLIDRSHHADVKTGLDVLHRDMENIAVYGPKNAGTVRRVKLP